MKTTLPHRLAYTYEEFLDHVKAMRTVREWEYTSRFGHLGSAQTSRANNARVLEYFSDSYDDEQEAVRKAELFLSIYDYIGRNSEVFSRKHFIEQLPGSLFSVDSALLRAVHFLFTVLLKPESVPIKKVLALASAFKALEP